MSPWNKSDLLIQSKNPNLQLKFCCFFAGWETVHDPRKWPALMGEEEEEGIRVGEGATGEEEEVIEEVEEGMEDTEEVEEGMEGTEEVVGIGKEEEDIEVEEDTGEVGVMEGTGEGEELMEEVEGSEEDIKPDVLLSQEVMTEW